MIDNYKAKTTKVLLFVGPVMVKPLQYFPWKSFA